MRNLFILVAALVIPPGVVEKLAAGKRPMECSMRDTSIAGEKNCTYLRCESKFPDKSTLSWSSADALCDQEEEQSEETIAPEYLNGVESEDIEFQEQYEKAYL